MGRLKKTIKDVVLPVAVGAGLMPFVAGCGPNKAPSVEVGNSQEEVSRVRTWPEATRDARKFVNDSNYIVVDSLIGPRFGDYLIKFKHKGDEIDSTRSIYVPKDLSRKPHDLYIADGVYRYD